MNQTLQKAPFRKRLAAWMFDGILLVILTFLLIAGLSSLLKIDHYVKTFETYYSHYEEQYGLDFGISAEDYNALSEEELALFNEAYAALTSDPEAAKAYSQLSTRTLITLELSFLLAYLLVDFLLPLMFKNGQTLGKKLTGIAVVRTNGERVRVLNALSRTVVGKFAVETLIPVMIICSLFFGSVSLVALIFAAIILIANMVLLFKKNIQLHDILADTTVVIRPVAPARRAKTEPIGQKAKISTVNIEEHS